MKLTGQQRLQLVMLWIKKGREGDKEEYIKAVCKLKGLEYTPPPLKSERRNYGTDKNRGGKG